jgi:dihydropteroate synthase
MGQNTAIPMKNTINCNGKLINMQVAHVMGIINVTPDSFHDGGQFNSEYTILKKAEEHILGGATFIDIGAVSSKPGANEISEEQELKRLIPAVESIVKSFPEAIISIDTFRSKVADSALAHGAHLINDIGAGMLDEAMFDLISMKGVPYIMMHMQGTPSTMQLNPKYNHVVEDVFNFLLSQATKAKAAGIIDIIIDPGFGFGKTLEHNYELLSNLERLKMIGLPILVGVSRKSMITKPLEITSAQALNGTTALHMAALERGATILRTHDSLEAMQCIKLWQAIKQA